MDVNVTEENHNRPTASPSKYFFAVAINVPLYQLFTYSYVVPIAPLTRVRVPFRGKEVMGIVVRTLTAPAYARGKIKAIAEVLDPTPIFGEEWGELMSFTASYYFYPPGPTFFSALPPPLKRPKTISNSGEYHSLLYKLTSDAAGKAPPQARFSELYLLWETLKTSFISLDAASFIHPRAKFYLEKYQRQGWLESREKTPRKTVYAAKKLNGEQEAARGAVLRHFHEFKTFLLFGITGSGKTEVYFSLIWEALQQKKQVLLLLPMINLTPQFFSRLKATFPETPIALLHSKIPAGFRAQEFLRGARGEAQIVVGTRLAVFTPLANLGLIVVDEENDDSFKQENELRYQARDLAIWRGKEHQCPVVLGSATPSLRSWQQAQNGRYELLTLAHRAVPSALLPEIQFLSTEKKTRQGFTDKILAAMDANLAAKELTLVYLNRRGFSSTLLCADCGATIRCDFCSANMVFHKEQNRLMCHHCGASKAPPALCPVCGNQDLHYLGSGTEKVEEFLRERYPAANILRVDSDTLATRHSWDQIYAQIIGGEVDIIIGTQLLAKGHDFAAVSLVVVLDADNSLFSADYRAGEKLFSDLMQVAGRAGRGEIKGRVLIPTRFPQEILFQALKKQDYVEFANAELKNRAAFAFPPYVARAVIKAEHPDIEPALEFLHRIQSALPPIPAVKVIGPLPMQPLKVAGRCRAILYLDSENRTNLRQTVKRSISKLLTWQKKYPRVKWIVDIDSNEA